MSDQYDGPAMAQHIYRLREQIARDTAEIETLKAERDAAVADADLHRTRCASIIFSGALDDKLAGEVHQWMRDYVDAKAERDAAVTALKNALNAIEQHRLHHERGCAYLDGIPEKIQAAIDAALAEPQPQPEPVAWVNGDILQGLTLGHYAYAEIYTDKSAGRVPLYTAPPQRKPLTEEEILKICQSFTLGFTDRELARAIERAHGIGGEA